MSVLSKLASMQGRSDEEPNKELGCELARTRDVAGIQEIAENLWHKDAKIQSDCDGVMEEIGRQAPELIEPYVSDFLKLLSSKRNRRVWQAMICLSLIADRKPREIFEHRETIVRVMEKGSVITQDNGIKILARIASAEETYRRELLPYLLAQLESCRPQSVPQYAESILCAVNAENATAYKDVLTRRLDDLSAAQRRRVEKVLKQV